MNRDELPTEARNPRADGLDQLSTRAALDVFHAEDATLAASVHAARDDIAHAIDLIASRLAAGGRLFYIGAGTSGRLGVLDAVECPPTFQSDPAQVRGLIAGGLDALVRSIEGAEDRRDDGAALLAANEVRPADVVFGIAAGGTTPFVHGAIERAKAIGAATVFFACVPAALVADEADISIRVITGPEILAGSTRLKAGTATKMVLNRVSTLVMVRLGKTHGNRMVDLNTTSNEKLRARGIRMVAELCDLSPTAAEGYLDRAGGGVKRAVVMHALDTQDPAAADRLLDRSGGFLRRALARAHAPTAPPPPGTPGESRESR